MERAKREKPRALEQTMTPNASLPTTSNYFNSLFRVLFHLSLAVLVNYRSLVAYLALGGIYHPLSLGLQYKATRLDRKLSLFLWFAQGYQLSKKISKRLKNSKSERKESCPPFPPPPEPLNPFSSNGSFTLYAVPFQGSFDGWEKRKRENQKRELPLPPDPLFPLAPTCRFWSGSTKKW